MPLLLNRAVLHTMRDKTAKVSSNYAMPRGTLLRVKLHRDLVLPLTLRSRSLANLSFNVLGDVLPVSTLSSSLPGRVSAPSQQ